MPKKKRDGDPFRARATLATALGEHSLFRLDALADVKRSRLENLPYSIRVLLESCLRNCDGYAVTEDTVKALVRYDGRDVGETEIPFMPARVILQDFTGVPAIVDLAAMRSAMVRMGGDPSHVNPLVPCDLVIDHSVQVDAFASKGAFAINSRLEFQRNKERYEFLKWGQDAFANFRVVPPATGIVHQVNLEHLARVVWERDGVLFPDSLVGTDSHTTMINGLGVVGWGVGGIEAEAVMLGQPIYMLIPEVVGVRLTGKLAAGTTATDLVLVVTQLLRKEGVVNKFVEFHGPGLAAMPVANRATIANMAPEYGATIGFFPVDEQTITYMRLTGRDPALVEAVEEYCRAQGLWRDDERPIVYSKELTLDLGTVTPSLAGPKRPQDRVALTDAASSWRRELETSYKKPIPARRGLGGTSGAGAAARATQAKPSVATMEEDGGVPVEYDGQTFQLRHGDVVIAAITSCTNTSNPSVMLGAGLLARKARALGLTRKPWVKTSLAPGSKVVTDYLQRSGTLEDLEALGFHVVGYGCTTCIGNSGPLPDPIRSAIDEGDLVVCSVLSGNRNFEGRIGPDVRANYLASPPLVVAYALAGTIDVDLSRDAIGVGSDGQKVYLRDIWPTETEVESAIASFVSTGEFHDQYKDVFRGSEEWRAIRTTPGALYQWAPESTYIQEPPFFVDLSPAPAPIEGIRGARCLARFGDSVTTDHISPAGSIPKGSPAGKYLIEHGVPPDMFNSYGARRGNDRVMTRGTFANIRIKNLLVPGTEGGVTRDFTTGETTTIYEAALHYRDKGIPLVVLAGLDYGMGSSRDWAAKGTFLLGARAVIAKSFERIHRSNLVGMGVLPLCFMEGEDCDTLGLVGDEEFTIKIDDELEPRQEVKVTATRPNGEKVKFKTLCRVDTPIEVEYYRNGGILHMVLRRMAKAK